METLQVALAERPTPFFSLGESWRAHYQVGMGCVHKLLGQERTFLPLQDITPDILLQNLNELATGRYRPAKSCADEFDCLPARSTVPPEVDPDRNYQLIGLNALTKRGRFVSVPAGGVVFEDPLWALLAAHALGCAHLQVAIPKANDNEDLWRKTDALVEAIATDNYQASAFFAAILGYLHPSNAPRFELLTIRGNNLIALRTRGSQSFTVNKGLRFTELFASSPSFG